MKYKLTDKIKIAKGVKFYQIQALKYFGNVKAGDLGGWIEKEENLSQYGNCWVYDNAQVSGNAWVYDNAQVSGNAWVGGNAEVSGDARVSDNAQVFGDARVYDNAQVFGDAKVDGNVQIYGDAQAFGDVKVFGNAWVFGDAKVSAMWYGGDAKVGGNTSTSTVKEQNPFDFNTLPDDVEEIVVKGIRYKKETKIVWKKIS